MNRKAQPSTKPVALALLVVASVVGLFLAANPRKPLQVIWFGEVLHEKDILTARRDMKALKQLGHKEIQNRLLSPIDYWTRFRVRWVDTDPSGTHELYPAWRELDEIYDLLFKVEHQGSDGYALGIFDTLTEAYPGRDKDYREYFDRRMTEKNLPDILTSMSQSRDYSSLSAREYVVYEEMTERLTLGKGAPNLRYSTDGPLNRSWQTLLLALWVNKYGPASIGTNGWRALFGNGYRFDESQLRTWCLSLSGSTGHEGDIRTIIAFMGWSLFRDSEWYYPHLPQNASRELRRIASLGTSTND